MNLYLLGIAIQFKQQLMVKTENTEHRLIDKCSKPDACFINQQKNKDNWYRALGGGANIVDLPWKIFSV